MNLEEFPESIKKDIEDQSLAILAEIAEDVVVIGGWAVRALAGENHRRYTLDIDCVASPESLPKIGEKLELLGLKVEKHGWGLLFHKRYEPPAGAPEDAREKARETMLRIEISPPRIAEAETPHYFEFSLENYKKAEISFHNKPGKVVVKVPPVEDMAAVKVGLPVDYKNNFDAAVLLALSDPAAVARSILGNDDWKAVVLRRMPKLVSRARDRGRIENTLMQNAGMSVGAYVKQLQEIERRIQAGSTDPRCR
ncbi:MAG: hypothetical protein SVE93_01880 [Candidatus Thermoplasmatota archaeon]|nr:hypothetical protein [Candidatus Thermoplasmatota archaeon]